MSNQVSKTGLFVVQFQIGKEVPGAPELHLSLTVNTVTHQVRGLGNVSQTTNPTLQLPTYVKGNYFISPLLPPAEYPITVQLTGWPAETNPLSTIVLYPNTEIFMHVNESWTAGVCSYKYELNGRWHPVPDVPVKIIQTAALTPVS
ncbi:DUF1842 domain-containing protein [Chitinophaga sp. Hz27]|uniref:DUF1842 domain-containing protein n=1 Tax=Chitinophaga sp. Hz27 TaxID=3347169 RepID=UPI0035D5AB40